MERRAAPPEAATPEEPTKAYDSGMSAASSAATAGGFPWERKREEAEGSTNTGDTGASGSRDDTAEDTRRQ